MRCSAQHQARIEAWPFGGEGALEVAEMGNRGGDVATSCPEASDSPYLGTPSPGEQTSLPNGPQSGRSLSRSGRARYPATKGKPGGKLPTGNRASRSPWFSFSAAERKAATNQEYIS